MCSAACPARPGPQPPRLAAPATQPRLVVDPSHLLAGGQPLAVRQLAFADREAWYGDPAAEQVPLDGLLDHRNAADRRALVGEAASLELRPGRPAGARRACPPPRWAASASRPGPSRPRPLGRGLLVAAQPAAPGSGGRRAARRPPRPTVRRPSAARAAARPPARGRRCPGRGSSRPTAQPFPWSSSAVVSWLVAAARSIRLAPGGPNASDRKFVRGPARTSGLSS
jgi:hypothetical protein